MANRRFAVHEIRHVISRMRLSESDRQIAKAGLMGRVKADKLRLLAQDQGWLNKDSPLPANEVIERLTRKTSQAQRGQSQVLPFADQVLAWAGQGIAWTTIHQTLVRKFAFNWQAFSPIVRLWIPTLKVMHPHPNQRFYAKHPR